MGCDGGTIPKRDELVRVKKKPEQVNSKVFYILRCKPHLFCETAMLSFSFVYIMLIADYLFRFVFSRFPFLFSKLNQFTHTHTYRKTKRLKWHIVGDTVP